MSEIGIRLRELEVVEKAWRDSAGASREMFDAWLRGRREVLRKQATEQSTMRMVDDMVQTDAESH